MGYPKEIKRALRTIIFAQCTGVISLALFNNGFMLAYLARLGIPPHAILFLLSITPLMGMLLTLPLAFIADRNGKKKIGGTGLIIALCGFTLLPLAGFRPAAAGRWIGIGTLVFAVGLTINSASWFALLSPIVPAEIRGRYFGWMRTAWQTASIVFSLAVAALLHREPGILVFQMVLAAAWVFSLIRIFLYRRIPELESGTPDPRGFFPCLRTVLKIPGYLSFCAYIFLLTLFTGTAPNLFGLLAKGVLSVTDSQLMILGNLTAAGMIAGFYTGGRLVDRLGTKPVFLSGQLACSLTLALVLLRGFIPLPPVLTVALCSFLYGSLLGMLGIAATSEMLAMVPKENKSLSTGLNVALIGAGLSLSGFGSGQLLKMNVLRPEWLLFGSPMSAYDTLLAGFMVMTALLVVTLGLVPKINHLRSQWMPQNR
ncbi:MAG: MFS transporter [Verrucomicrobia bacterium]|nr:MFS transporter [Verrucomicrobiota bacterium]